MDITKLKELIKSNIKLIIVILVFLIIFISSTFYLSSFDKKIAIKLINNDLLTRSIDEENYIINHNIIFDEELLRNNISSLFKENNLSISFNVKVDGNKCDIYIGNEHLSYEIVSITN